MASGVLAGLGLHPTAEAGAGSSGSSSGDVADGSDSETGSTDGDTTGEGSSVAGEDPATGPCLSVSPPSDGCECGPTDDPASPLALLLPALALRRRGGRRGRIDQLADAGRLPPDVISRLRARLDDDG